MSEKHETPGPIAVGISKELSLEEEALERAQRMIVILDEIPGESRKTEVSRTINTLRNLVEIWKNHTLDNAINQHRQDV